MANRPICDEQHFPFGVFSHYDSSPWRLGLIYLIDEGKGVVVYFGGRSWTFGVCPRYYSFSTSGV